MRASEGSRDASRNGLNGRLSGPLRPRWQLELVQSSAMCHHRCSTMFQPERICQLVRYGLVIEQCYALPFERVAAIWLSATTLVGSYSEHEVFREQIQDISRLSVSPAQPKL